MQALGIAATLVSTVGTLTSASQAAASAKSEGKAAEAIAEYNARQIRYKAGQERAVSQKRAEEARRQARLATGRARAVAAASGGGTGGSVMDILAALRGEGEYNAQTALYEGEETAKGLEAQADAALAEGQFSAATGRYKSKAIKRAGYMSAAGNLLSGAASFYDKYWPQEDETTSQYGELTGGPGRTRKNWG